MAGVAATPISLRVLLEGAAAGLPGGPHLSDDPTRPKGEEVLLWTIRSFVRCHSDFRG